MLTPVGLSALETACCLVFGGDPAPRARASGRQPEPAGALVDALAETLRRPPCVVAFSGGRDSSLVLAAAVVAARRERLPPPLPVTLRFPAAPDSEESRWQERVIAHLGVDDWVCVELPAGLDFIGAVARPLLAGQGPFFPPNAHIVAPLLEHAAGGTIVGGLGGDELFTLWERRRIADVAARRSRPRWGDAIRIAGALVPARVRRVVVARRAREAPLPWLRPAAQRQLEAILAEQRAYATIRWDRHAAAVPRARSLHTATRDLNRIAATAGAEFRAPLLDPRFTAALGAAGGWRGFGDRGATMRALFSELLPADVLGRRHKATFNDAFFTPETRRFADAWSGGGLDETVVDPASLRDVWRTAPVDYRSALLLQSAWLHDHRAVAC